MSRAGSVRRTVGAETIAVAGRGLFTGVASSVVFRPRESGGIVFRRVDLAGTPEVPARVSRVGSDPRLPGRNTILVSDPSRAPGADNPAVVTVEHAMSALAGLGVTDATVDVGGPELPIADGSSRDFVAALSRAGVRDLRGGLEPIVVRERIAVRDERSGAEIVAEPLDHDGLELSYTLDYSPAPGPPSRTFAWSWDADGYGEDVAPARTFCLEREAVALRAAGLFTWVTPREMLVLNDSGAPVENSLRFADEPARHKLLDLLGDLALAGVPLRGRFTARRSGHALNAAMARRLTGAPGA